MRLMATTDTNVLVRDLMPDAIITCARDAPLASVAAILARQRAYAVFVWETADVLRAWSAT
jgi:hypothetical protein